MPPITRVPSRNAAHVAGMQEHPATFQSWAVPRTKAVDIVSGKRPSSPLGAASSGSPTELLAGTFGEYQLTGSSLGSGGFASVLEAIDCETGGSLAIKTMERRNDHRDEKIRREIDIMTWLSEGLVPNNSRSNSPATSGGGGGGNFIRSASEPCLAGCANEADEGGAGAHEGPVAGHGKFGKSCSADPGKHFGGIARSARTHRDQFFNAHITAIRDCVVTPERVHIVMSAARCNMADFIASKGRLGDREARRLFRQLVTAVSYCHNMGVCHRDIKLENILIGHDGRSLEIADFGLSKFVDPATFLCSSVVGTPRYIAPEVLLRRQYDGRKSDVWACGVVLFAMLNGRLPFHSFRLKSLKRWVAFVEIAAKMTEERYRGLILAQFVKVRVEPTAKAKPPRHSRSISFSSYQTPTRRTSGGRHVGGSHGHHHHRRTRSGSGTQPASSWDGSGGHSVVDNAPRKRFAASSAARSLVQDMLRFHPEDRADTDEISFHPWMHPEEGGGDGCGRGRGRSRACGTPCTPTRVPPASLMYDSAEHGGGSSSRSSGSSGGKDKDHAADSSGELERTRRAVGVDSNAPTAAAAAVWAPDSSAHACTMCGKDFHFLVRRRHHCRRCGQLFCAACAPKRNLAKLPEHARDFVPVQCPGGDPEEDDDDDAFAPLDGGGESKSNKKKKNKKKNAKASVPPPTVLRMCGACACPE